MFDGGCPYCGMASGTVEKLNSDLKIVNWHDKASQSFLEAQFNSTPFSMVFVDYDRSKVLVGDTVADKVASKSKVL